MFFSESQLLVNPDYLISLITYSKFVTEKQLEVINSQIKEQRIPVTPQFEMKGKDAHIYIYGPLVSEPDPYLILYSRWSTTYESIRNDIKQVYEQGFKPEKVYFHFDSPGGTAQGVDETWQAIMDLREDFEVIAINEGNLSSGAYWLASAANKIISTSEINRQGSIGALAGYIDFSKAMEKEGVSKKILVSKNAKYKHFSIDQDGFDEKLQEQLDELEDIFIARISEGRNLTTNEIIENFGQGSTLLSKAAVQVKMIDGIGLNLNSDKDSPVTMELIIKGEKDEMTLEEMLNDPGVQAEIASARKSGRESAFSDVKGVMSFIISTEYPQEVKDLAVEVCEGNQPRAALDVLVNFCDRKKAEDEARLNASDPVNNEPSPAIQPDFGKNERTVEERTKAVQTMKGIKV